MSACRRMQIDPYLSPCTKLKFKWIKDLNIKREFPQQNTDSSHTKINN
ncbi:Retrovirus-related Pol polyprotein LINE-1 [Trichinella zimbabwensis]|uniref:Retrovirus-related Pol polyprotein LINE-1 n=1 Tax=Trichinella zimbabwensis TaxID=268475 RepID=A0A0V1G7M3_9BILA|nr:Retrovirus-related Pol polyprotein LINE-1 [Trichinella zimbabwensis]